MRCFFFRISFLRQFIFDFDLCFCILSTYVCVCCGWRPFPLFCCHSTHFVFVVAVAIAGNFYLMTHSTHFGCVLRFLARFPTDPSKHQRQNTDHAQQSVCVCCCNWCFFVSSFLHFSFCRPFSGFVYPKRRRETMWRANNNNNNNAICTRKGTRVLPFGQRKQKRE